MLNVVKLLVDISNLNSHFDLITDDFKAISKNRSTNDTKTTERAHFLINKC